MTEELTKGRLELIEFHWWVANDGYRLGKSPPDSLSPFLPGTDVIEIKPQGLNQHYTPDPLDPIHRRFEGLSDDPSAFIGFADEYGLPIDGPVAVESMIEMRESVAAVLAAVNGVNTAKGDMERGRARSYACRALTERAPKLTMGFSRALTKSGKETIALKAKPAALFDYMLLLAAFELQETAAWRPCSQCGTIMPLGRNKGRRHRDTCSDACRQKKRYRKQKGLGHASQG